MQIVACEEHTWMNKSAITYILSYISTFYLSDFLRNVSTVNFQPLMFKNVRYKYYIMQTITCGNG